MSRCWIYMPFLLLTGCSAIELSPTIPFVKMTVPAMTQLAPRQPLTAAQVPGDAERYNAMLSAYQLQQQELKSLRADLAGMMAVQQAQRQADAWPVRRPQRAPSPGTQPAKPFATRAARPNQNCEFLMRDLSRPDATVVYCKP